MGLIPHISLKRTLHSYPVLNGHPQRASFSHWAAPSILPRKRGSNHRNHHHDVLSSSKRTTRMPMPVSMRYSASEEQHGRREASNVAALVSTPIYSGRLSSREDPVYRSAMALPDPASFHILVGCLTHQFPYQPPFSNAPKQRTFLTWCSHVGMVTGNSL